MVGAGSGDGDCGGDTGVMVIAVALVANHFRRAYEEKTVHIYRENI